jgi:hypothetical protein
MAIGLCPESAIRLGDLNMKIYRIRFMTVLLACFAVLLQAASVAAQQRPGIRPFVDPPEGCYLNDPAEPENIDSFLRIQIQALSLAHRGELANLSMLRTKGGAPMEDMAKTIAGLREERIENACASFLVAYFAESQNPTMETVANFLVSAYDQLGKMSDQMLGINLQKSLHKVAGPSPQKQLSDLLEQRREILEDMTNALTLSLELLIDKARGNAEGQPDHLILKKAQVLDLLDYLYSRFPALKDTEHKDIAGDFIQQAASIQAFLTSGYKPAELP